MQGTEYFTGWRAKVLRMAWLAARDAAVFSATKLHKLGVTKQLANRLLEPFLYHTVLITGTEWENFFALRYHKDAEIHIQELAKVMLEAANASTPKMLKAGEWHTPFGDEFDEMKLWELNIFPAVSGCVPQHLEYKTELKLKIATARCARLSYMTLGDNPAKHDYIADLDTFGSLLERPYTNRKGMTWTAEDPIHASPAEHCAQCMSRKQYLKFRKYEFDQVEYGWCGNFKGFIQFRKMLANENKKDARLLKK